MTDQRLRTAAARTTVVILLFMAANTTQARRDGLTGRSGKIDSATCRECHTGTGNQTVSISGPDSVTPNQRVTYTVTLSGATITASGIGIAASDGQLTINTAETGLRASDGELTHTQPKTVDAAKWVFDWTAPSSGTQTLYVASIAANGDGTPGGDSFGQANHAVVVGTDVDPARDATAGGSSTDAASDAGIESGDASDGPYVVAKDGSGSGVSAGRRNEAIEGGCTVARAAETRPLWLLLLWMVPPWMSLRRVMVRRRRSKTRARITMLWAAALLLATAHSAATKPLSTKVVVLWRGPTIPPEAQHRLNESLKARYRVVPSWLLHEACTQLGISARRKRSLRRCAQRIGVHAVISNRRSGKKRLVVKILDVQRGRWLRSKTMRWDRRPTPEMLGITARSIKRALRPVVANRHGSRKAVRTVAKQRKERSVSPRVPTAKRHRQSKSPARTPTATPRKGPTPPAEDAPAPQPAPKPAPEPTPAERPKTDVILAMSASRPRAVKTSMPPARRHTGLISVSVAIGLSGRSLEIVGDAGSSRYDGDAYPEIALRTEVYPLLPIIKNWARHFGLSACYAQALSVQSKDPRDAQDLATTSRELLIDLRYRLFWGQHRTSPIFAASAGWGLRDFGVEDNPVVTSFAYRFVRLGLSAHVPLRTPFVGLSMTADLRPLYHAGTEALDALGDRKGGIAFALRPGVFGELAKGLQYFASFEFLFFYSRFAGRGEALSRPESADRADATVSKDIFLRFWVGASYAL